MGAPHIEYLEGVAGDPDALPERRGLAELMLMFEVGLASFGGCFPSRDPAVSQLEKRYDFLNPPGPRYALPRPATDRESIASVMMIEAHLIAADFGVNLGDYLVDALYFAKEPEDRTQCIADGGPGRPRGAEIAEAMLQAGRIASERLMFRKGRDEVRREHASDVAAKAAAEAGGILDRLLYLSFDVFP